MLGTLPPVGHPVALSRNSPVPDCDFKTVFGNRPVYLCQSGTMALALALQAAKEVRKVSSPEVLLPAYACPDLISAAVYAGVKPVLVDLAPNRPWLDLDVLRSKINPNTVAVVAAHFLGVPERLDAIRGVISGTNILLIEDSAQAFPQWDNGVIWHGDLVVLSFGRGKPVSLLGGGAVLCNNLLDLNKAPGEALRLSAADNHEGSSPGFMYRLKARVYNQLLRPFFYGLTGYLPFLNIGKTVYKPLMNIVSFDVHRLQLLWKNVCVYQNRESDAPALIAEVISKLDCTAVTDFGSGMPAKGGLPLLRYPILVQDEDLRDLLHKNLAAAGLGSSKMYVNTLPAIEGLEGMFDPATDIPQAEQFSRRLLTLPCHSGVSKKHVTKMGDIIRQTLMDSQIEISTR